MACSREGHYILERADPMSLPAFSGLQPKLQLSPSVVALQPSNLGKPWAIRAGLPRHMINWLEANCRNLIYEPKMCRSAIQQIESTGVENDKWAQKELKFLATNCWQPLPTMSRRVVFHPFYFVKVRIRIVPVLLGSVCKRYSTHFSWMIPGFL